MIRLEGVGKRFQPPRPGGASVVALTDVSLEIPRATVWAFVGPNGAGKTTLFSLLLGFLHPTAGTISIHGTPPREYARATGFGYMPERFDLPGEWSVRSALLAFARLEGLSKADAQRSVTREIERYDLESHASAPARALSRGLMQRAGLAQAGLAARDIIVLDEPTQGLDPAWRIRFRERVREFRLEGRTVLLASHDLNEVERLADHAVLLEAGSIRRVIEMERRAGEVLRYLLEVSAGAEHVRTAFGDAAQGSGADTGGRSFIVPVEDARDLSRRLAAFVELGGAVAAVRPLGVDLEREFNR